MSDNIKELKDLEREMAEAEASEKHDESCHSGPGWGFGAWLIGLGVFFLLTTFTGLRMHNWWAAFLFIPAFGSLGGFLRAYQKDGFSNEARGSLIGAMFFFTLAATFIFGLSWSMIWPVFLIIGGVAALTAGLAAR